MVRIFIGLVGVIIFVLSIFLYKNIKTGEKLAFSLDNQEEAFGFSEIPPCTWEVNPIERVVSENKSQAVVVNFSNATSAACESVISLRAPSFDISPLKEEQDIKLDSGKNGSLSWIITPKKTGVYEIAVSDILNTKVFGITVKNIFGLSTLQARLFSSLGTIFGPMLTVPWWWDRLRRKRENKLSAS